MCPTRARRPGPDRPNLREVNLKVNRVAAGSRYRIRHTGALSQASHVSQRYRAGYAGRTRGRGGVRSADRTAA
eukprot:4796689-Prymnesium_polylepis.1